ncbi:hypothetical protein HYS91_05795 [Candidatus Daviesbacteria bacterium]|nr:hypothetical protein [Candidatus Daviesbacteria bacterium]
MSKKLLFVYNADSSLFNQLGDLIHKTLSPKTYQCNLCGLTYSGTRMKSDWKQFVDSLPIQTEFLHKDEFFRRFPDQKSITFPIAFIQENGSLGKIISTQEINQAKNLEELKQLVQGKVSNIKV